MSDFVPLGTEIRETHALRAVHNNCNQFFLITPQYILIFSQNVYSIVFKSRKRERIAV